MTDRAHVRQATREVLVQLLFLPLAVLAFMQLHGSWRIFTIDLVAIASYMTIDGLRGTFKKPIRPAIVTASLVSNTLLVALLTAVFLISIRF